MTGQQFITRDFSRRRLPINFTADGDTFRCQKALPMGHLGKLATVMVKSADDETVDPNEAINRIKQVMKLVMKKESYARFLERFEPELDEEGNIVDEDWEPFDQNQLMDTVKWLVEVYTKDLTQSSSSSSTGSETGSTEPSSTDGAPVAEWTQAVYQETGSATS